MTQYIDKSAVVAEIEKKLQEEYPCDNPEQTTGYHCALYELQDFLDTFEVKEINSTDIFIEKACEWIDFFLRDLYIFNSNDMQGVIEEFEKYMKGE